MEISGLFWTMTETYSYLDGESKYYISIYMFLCSTAESI